MKIPLLQKDRSSRQNDKTQNKELEVKKSDTIEAKDELLVTFFDKNFAQDNTASRITEGNQETFDIPKGSTAEKLNFSN